jgi:hypothetical protein
MPRIGENDGLNVYTFQYSTAQESASQRKDVAAWCN